MKMKMAVVAALLLVSAQTASADYRYYWWNPYWDTNAAENDLSSVKTLREVARAQRALTGSSDSAAAARLERECTRALERGVENGVRLSYGCRD
jgi:hypothetical protein